MWANFLSFLASVVYPPQPLVKHITFAVFACGLLLIGLLTQEQLEVFELHTDAGISYRWMSAHFVHLGFQHTLMNVAGALAIWLLCVSVLPANLLVTLLLLLPLGISAGLVGGAELPLSYRGFSGAIEGFFVVGVIWQWWLSRIFSVVLGAFVVGKLIVEQMPNFDDTYLMDSIGGLVSVDSHLYGVIVGVVCATLYLTFAYFKVPYFFAPWRCAWATTNRLSSEKK